MGFLEKAKAAAEQATAKAKEGVSDVQTKRDLSTAYNELGQKAFELADTGAISHAEVIRARRHGRDLARGDRSDRGAHPRAEGAGERRRGDDDRLEREHDAA